MERWRAVASCAIFSLSLPGTASPQPRTIEGVTLDQEISSLQKDLGPKLKKAEGEDAIVYSRCGIDMYTVDAGYDELRVEVADAHVYLILLRQFVPQTRPYLLAPRFIAKYGAPREFLCILDSKSSHFDTVSEISACSAARHIMWEYRGGVPGSKDDYKASVNLATWDPYASSPNYQVTLSRGFSYHYDRTADCRIRERKQLESEKAQAIRIPQ